MELVRGYVVPVLIKNEWRCTVAIASEAEEFYVIPKGVGADLTEHISKHVEVECTITRSEDSPPRIQIRTYKLVDELDDDKWYEDDDD